MSCFIGRKNWTESDCHCLRNFVSLDNFAGAVRPACHSQTPHCPSQPCMHGSQCLEGWNRFHCDCTVTPFTGPTCGKGKEFSYNVTSSRYATFHNCRHGCSCKYSYECERNGNFWKFYLLNISTINLFLFIYFLWHAFDRII